MNEHHTLPVVSFVFQPVIAALWAVGSFLTWVLLGLETRTFSFLFFGMLYFSFLLVVVEYGMDIVEQTAKGVAKAPSFTQALKASDSRLIRAAVALAIAFAIMEGFPSGWQTLPMMVLLAIAPAVMSSITFNEPLIQALNPLRIYQFMSNMGVSYISLRAVTTSVGLFALYAIEDQLGLLDSGFGRVLISGLLCFLVLMMLRATGALLHIRRQELGIQTLFSEEQAQAAADANLDDDWKERLKQINLTLKMDSFESAWKRLDQELQKQKYQEEPRVYRLLKNYDDRRLLQRVASGYISRLLPTQPLLAMEVFEERWQESGGSWRLHSGTLVLNLLKRADTTARRRALYAMLADFETRFPDHPRRREAELHAASLAAELHDFEASAQHLKRVKGMQGKVDKAEFLRIRQLISA